MARPPTLTDEEILRRARSIFVEQGYAARTKDVAAAVGLSWGAVVLRFGGKWEVFRRAMADSAAGPGTAAFDIGGHGDLRDVLERLRARLWEQWPLRLQYRLATARPAHDGEPDGLLDSLAMTLEAHASRGAVRSDMSANALAQVVLAMLVGDVAQRFVARERTWARDRTFIDRVMTLLTPR